MKISWWMVLALGGAAGLLACSVGAQVNSEGEEPSRRRVTRAAMRADNWQLVYCTGGENDAALVGLLREIADARPFDKNFHIVSCEGMGPEPAMIFGDRLPAGMEGLPVRRGEEGGFVFRDTLMATGDDLLVLHKYKLPQADTGTTVATFFLRENLDRLVRSIRQTYGQEWGRILWNQWAYELIQAEGTRYYGSYAGDTWAFDPEGEFAMRSPDEPVYRAEGLELFAYDEPVAPEQIEKVATAIERISKLIGKVLPIDTNRSLRVNLYPTIERIGLRLGDMSAIQVKDGVLHLVPTFVKDPQLDHSVAVWRAFLEARIISPDYSGPIHELIHLLQWNRSSRPQHYAPVANQSIRLMRALNLSPEQLAKEMPSDLIQEHLYRAKSDPVLERASAWAQRKGEQSVFRMLATETPPDDLVELVTSWPTAELQAGPLTSIANRPRTVLPPYNGMTFAHEGYRVYNGYGGSQVEHSLDSLATLGVNALSIVPYSFMRNPAQVTELPVPDDAGSENDAAVCYSIRGAKERDWFVLLKPQIWIGGGSWPGDVDFDTPEDWAQFFHEYTLWIMHYALVAEREGVDALCLGTELVKTTRQHPEAWRKIIAKVRTVFGGQLTYAANWGEEFENLSFWGDLDAIGLNSYYPLSSDENPTDEQLLAGARRWMRMADSTSRAFDRPLWLTEVGYRSVTAPWVNPHAEPSGRSFDGEAQARCFAALTTAAGESERLQGMFVWKWPSYMGYVGGRRGQGTGFTPGGKLAGEVLGSYYQLKMSGR